MIKHTLGIGVAFAALVGHPLAAAARDAGRDEARAADASAPSPGEGVAQTDAQPVSTGEIVVTAQKRSERLLSVPMSVAVITGAQLARGGVQSMDDLREVTPGVLTVNNGFAFLPQIRGIQSSGTSPGDATNVAIYLDDVSAGAPIAGLLDLSDIDRVEVLKGPQGTLFGRNATGGAIRIFTKDPSFTPGGGAGVDYGFTYHDVKLTSFLTGPLSDTVAASVSGAYRKGDGYITGIGPDVGRMYGGPDNYAVRGKILFKPNSDFRAVLEGDTWSQQNNNTFTAGYIGNVNPYPGSIYSGIGTYAGNVQPFIDLRGSDASLDMKWEPSDALHARFITAYRHWRIDAQNDGDLSDQPFVYVQIGQYENSFSEELNFSGNISPTISWIGGAYYFSQQAANPYFIVGLGNIGTNDYVENFHNHVHAHGIAGFGELNWNPVAPLHLTAGARYSSETKDFFFQYVVPTGLSPTDVSHTWNSPTFRFVARYDLTHDANVYASVSDGFKSGVYNAYSPLNNPVNPEKVTAYEVGAKAKVGNLTFTAAAYAYEYKDIQVSAYVTVNGNLLVSLSNAASARMRGLELTVDGKLAEGLNFNAGLNWEPTAKYVNYTGAQVVQPIPGATGPVVAQVVVPYDASGSHTVRTPQFSANARLHYETPVFGGRFKGDVDGAYTAAFYWQPGNYSREAPAFIGNARLGWTDKHNFATYSVYVTNFTNQRYFTDRVPNVLGSDTAEVAPGREFGIGLNLAF